MAGEQVGVEGWREEFGVSLNTPLSFSLPPLFSASLSPSPAVSPPLPPPPSPPGSHLLLNRQKLLLKRRPLPLQLTLLRKHLPLLLLKPGRGSGVEDEGPARVLDLRGGRREEEMVGKTVSEGTARAGGRGCGDGEEERGGGSDWVDG